MRLAFGLVAILVVSAHAEVTLSQGALERETPLARAVAPLGFALRNPDRTALDTASRDVPAALRAFNAYLDAHPSERTAELARIATAAAKLAQAVDHLRRLLDGHGDGGEIHRIAIDCLHRFNEFLDAHQGSPPLKEILIPDDLVERFVAVLERAAHDAQEHKGDCKKMGAALATHAANDAAIMKALQDIDDSQPQDQREAERTAPSRPKFAARFAKAIEQRAPMFACKSDPNIAAYVKDVEDLDAL